MKKPRRKHKALWAAIGRRGLPQTDIALSAGVSRETLCRLVNDRQEPTPETARRVAKALGTTVGKIWPELES